MTVLTVEALVEHGLLAPMPVEGGYGWSGAFADVADAVTATLRRMTGEGAERLRFASVMPRADLEAIGYFRSFPHLLGTVHCFCGDDAAHRELVRKHDAGEAWTDGQTASDLVMIPAACYPIYRTLARRGAVPDGGYRVQVEANCFRREPSSDPCRMQSFHMHEIVRIGREEDVTAFRDHWLERGSALLASWGLEGEVGLADDPFFGRTATVLAKSQRAKALKFEWRAIVSDLERPTACMSGNYHMDSFGRSAGLQFADGTVAHSACVGFGIERISLALFRQHGLDWPAWPAPVRQALGL
jgi:seryl-tRNA synthetase